MTVASASVAFNGQTSSSTLERPYLEVDGLTAFSGCASADDVGAVLTILSAWNILLSSDALHEDLCVFFNPNRHQAPPPMSSTIFCAPSARSSADEC